MKKPSKKNILAVFAGVAVAAAVTASAASLGGLSTQWLGANSNVVEPQIQNGLDVTWDTAYDAASGYYVVDGFTVATSNDDESLPEGAELKLTLKLTGDATQEFTGAIGTDGSIVFDTTPLVAAHDVVGVSVVIVGGGSETADLP